MFPLGIVCTCGGSGIGDGGGGPAGTVAIIDGLGGSSGNWSGDMPSDIVCGGDGGRPIGSGCRPWCRCGCLGRPHGNDTGMYYIAGDPSDDV